jgi:hypothetical protein
MSPKAYYASHTITHGVHAHPPVERTSPPNTCILKKVTCRIQPKSPLEYGMQCFHWIEEVVGLLHIQMLLDLDHRNDAAESSITTHPTVTHNIWDVCALITSPFGKIERPS